MITPDLLRAAVGCTPERAQAFAGPLSEACALFEVNTPARLAAFLAQVGHESASLRYTSELWGPTPAQQRYEGRADLGNTQPGDGSRYRGHGLLQTTGRANHRELRPALLLAGYEAVPDFEAEPERLTEPRWAAASAGFFWASRSCNALADAGAFEAITRKINGGTNGLADRIARLSRAQAALAAIPSPAPIAEPAAPIPAAPPPIHYTPAGEADAPEQQEQHMAPFIAAALPALIDLVPKLGSLFGSGSAVADRNIKAAEVVVAAAKEAIGARNEQELVETIKADPAAAVTVKQAVEARWLDITEAGGGGVEGARKADMATQSTGDIRKSASFWIALLMLPLVYLLVLSLIGLIGTATWSDDVRAGLAGSLISAIVGGLIGYYYGQTTSRNRSNA